MPDTYSLICEGPCNPTIGVYLDAEGSYCHEKREDVSSLGLIIDQVRLLKYTPHEKVGVTRHVGGLSLRYRCTVCGWARRFGLEEGLLS